MLEKKDIYNALSGAFLQNFKFHLSNSRYPTSIASLSFAADGSVLAIASSYMYEDEEIPRDLPEDAIYIRYVSDQETKPK